MQAEEVAEASPRATTSVSLNVPATIEFADVMATPDGATTTASAEIEVTTTASAGYKLYVYAEDNTLKSLNPQTQQTIAATAQTSGVEELANNTWGYNLSEGTTAGTTFAALPTSDATPVAEKDTSVTGGATGDIYTLALGAKVDSTMPSGTYTATMTVAAVADPAGVVVTYDANGGYYNDDSSQTTQLVEYAIKGNPETKIAKTSNISDDGVQSGGYGDNVEETQTVTIPGAESLQVTVSYQTENTSYDWLAIYDGSVTPSQSNYSDSVTGKLGGSTKVDNEVFIIPGDTAQFYFRSDSSSSNYYGYYAVVQEAPTITPSAEVLTPTRPGYDFIGWYKDSAGTPGEEFVINASLQAGTVYAKWGINYLDDVTYMQDLTAAQCTNSYDGATATLIDRRDNNGYSIAKINGTCWMTQNLRIASGTQLTSADSNLPEGTTYTIPTEDLTLGNSYTEGRVHAGEPSNGESATDTGYWYNYCAASAGQVCSRTQMNATQDICPKGWSLPNKDQKDGLGGATYLSAFAPVTGGNYNNGTLGTTSSGYWWSSTARGGNYQYGLSYNGSNLGTNGYYYKDNGFYVRCVRSS